MMKKLFYGFGSLSFSVISQTMANFFMFFATTVLNLSGTLVGIAVAIATIWDGVSDTLIGYFSDNHSMGRLGKRNGLMLIATIGMSVSNIALWCVPIGISPILKFVWIILSLLIIETFNTMFSTPYMALGNELSTSYHDRTKINAHATVFFLLGIIIPSILLYVFLPSTAEYPIGQLNPHGYVKIAITTSAICFVFGVISSLFTTRYIKTRKVRTADKEKFNFKILYRNFIIAFQNAHLRKIIFGYVLTSVATVFICSVGLHFFTYSFFYSSAQITFLLMSLLIGTIISQPLWVYISKRNEKKPALIYGILLTIGSIFGVIFIYLFRIQLYEISFSLMLIAIFTCGIGSGSLYSLPTSIYGDAIMKLKSANQDLTATYSGTITFASNIANSLTQLAVGILLDVIRFDSTVQVQTLAVQTGLALILFVGVQLALILACLIFSRVNEKEKIYMVKKRLKD